MSTKGSLFYCEDGDVHVYHDVEDNLIHITTLDGSVAVAPSIWRDIVADCATVTLKNATPISIDTAPVRPECARCGKWDVAHFLGGPCPGFEAKP